jgi:hypothetical protein
MLEMIDVTNTTESLATDFTPETMDSQNEQTLEKAITGLWSAHLHAKNTARATKDELHAIRARLGEQLSEMKKLLASPGRDGQWSGFLRNRQIPRATADRLVARHQRSLNPDANRLSEPVSESTDEEVQRLFIAVWPRLRRTLKSEKSLQLFVDLLTYHCQHSERPNREIPAVMPAMATDDPPSSDGDSMVEPEFYDALTPQSDQGVVSAP